MWKLLNGPVCFSLPLSFCDMGMALRNSAVLQSAICCCFGSTLKSHGAWGMQGYAGELDVEAELAGMEERRRPFSAGERIRGGIAKGGKKRQAKDAKFGKTSDRTCICSLMVGSTFR